MKKHLFSRIMLVLLTLNAYKLIASPSPETPDDLTRSVKRGRNYTLGPSLDDVPCIVTLELLLQEPFRQQTPLKIKPQDLTNSNQTYNLYTPAFNLNTSTLDVDEKKAIAYLQLQKEKSLTWRKAQNELKNLKPYSSEPLDEGERDSLKGARRTDLALQWLKAQIYELKITINRVNYLIEVIEQEYKIKSQILKDYRQAQTDNSSQSYFNINAWYGYAKNYGFTEKLCSALWAIYGFQFKFEIIDDQSRKAHEKREAFVSEIPKSYTPKTLPRKPKNTETTNLELSSSPNDHSSRDEYNEFLMEEQRAEPEISITFDEYRAYQKIMQDEKKEDTNFSMTYQGYRAYLECIKILPELQIRPKDYMIYATAQRKMTIALSYQDYLDKIGIREELKSRLRKKEPHKEHAIKFSSLKQELLNLLGDYQGENKGLMGGFLGKYLEWHEKIEELDKDLLKLKIISISLYQPQVESSNPLTTPLSLTRPSYIIRDNFESWEEIGDVTALDLVPIKDRLNTKAKKKNFPQGKTENSLPNPFIQKSKEFIRKTYLDFGSEIFLLGLCSDQVGYLYQCLQENISYMIRGLRPIKIGGKEWVVSLTPITHLEFKAEEVQGSSKIPVAAQHSDPTVSKRLEERIEAYQQEVKNHQDAMIMLQDERAELAQEIDKVRQAQKVKLKELSEELNILNSPISASADFEEEQQQIVDILSNIFMPQEVQDVSALCSKEEDEFFAIKSEIARKRTDLRQILQARKASKVFDNKEKIQIDITLKVLEYISSILIGVQPLKEKEKEFIQKQTEAYNIQWLYYFYAHLQSLPWKQHQRLTVSFETISNEDQFDKTQVSVLNFIRMAYKDLYEDILGFKSQKEVSISTRKPRDNCIEILVDLEDLQPPLISK